jgi:hypothetical protein
MWINANELDKFTVEECTYFSKEGIIIYRIGGYRIEW